MGTELTYDGDNACCHHHLDDMAVPVVFLLVWLLGLVTSVHRSSSLDWKKDRNRTEPNRKRPDHRLRLHKF